MAGSVVRASTRPTAMNAATGQMTSNPTPATEPAFQNRSAFSDFWSDSATAVVIAARNTVIPCPARASVSGLPAPRPMLASPNTTTPATAAPRKANQTYWNGSANPNTAITDTTANEAPEFTPSRPVSAIGLRVYPWISAPPTPSAMPATIASTVRGTRTVRTMSLISVSRWSGSGAGEQPVPHLGRAQRARADGQRHRRRGHEDHHERAQTHNPPPTGLCGAPGNGAFDCSRAHVSVRHPYRAVLPTPSATCRT